MIVGIVWEVMRGPMVGQNLKVLFISLFVLLTSLSDYLCNVYILFLFFKE